MQPTLKIAVSKLSANYENWLKKLYETIEIIDLYTTDQTEIITEAQLCDGILLSGGCDVHPVLYNEPENLDFCSNIDERRDKIELEVIKVAIDRKIPLLGICRGEQILNVAFKGSLHPDIPSVFPCAEKHVGVQGDSWHPVVVSHNSLLAEFTGLMGGQVNSSHHQCINRVAPGLRVTATSPDDIIEAVEADQSIDHPFCLAVQWHPERMELENPFSGLLGTAFIQASLKCKTRSNAEI